MYRSQLLLQQLGIQQWISKQQVTQQVTADMLWTDKEVEHQIVTTNLITQPQKLTQTVQTQSDISQATAKNEIQDHHLLDQSTVVSAILVETDLQEIEYPQDIYLNYQVITHEHFILLAEVHADQEQTLLDNICKATHADAFFLQWPLALETWDMNDYVLESYLLGVFAIHKDKQWFALGEIDQTPFKSLNKQFKLYASLKQLLETPVEKKALWEGLFPLIYDTEQ